jgi:hypothetical protein
MLFDAAHLAAYKPFHFRHPLGLANVFFGNGISQKIIEAKMAEVKDNLESEELMAFDPS